MKKILLLIVLIFTASLFAKEIKLTEKQAESLRESINGYPKVAEKNRSILKAEKPAKRSTHEKTIVR